MPAGCRRHAQSRRDRKVHVNLRHAIVLAALALLPWLGAPARADDPKPDPGSVESEGKAAFQAARAALKVGPLQIPLTGQATLSLPADYAYIPPTEAARLTRAMGNAAGDNFLGMVVPHLKDGSFSFYELSYEAAGYIKDDDARDWKADELLQQLREGTTEGNKRRAAMGVGEIEVTGWIEPPTYNAERHQLVWSVGARTKGAPADEAEGVNYRTLILGREGYVAMTLVTDKAHLDELRPATSTLLDKLSFDTGKRYADFNSSTDRVAEFGLAALVAGVAAKKLGLLALAAAFAVKFAKVIVLAVGGLIWAARKRLGLGRKTPPPIPTAMPITAEAPPAAAAPAPEAPPHNPGPVA